MIFDLECDGFNPTKIHVLAYHKDGEVHHTHDYDEMRKVILNTPLLIGHRISLFDVPVLEKILKIKVKAKLIDTLALSWYLNHSRVVHGLEAYGVEFGVAKPKVVDWVGLSPEEYAHRCREDVKINLKLWLQLKNKLLILYKDKDKADRLIDYLMFKMDCVKEQARSQWKVDMELVEASFKDLSAKAQEKVDQLTPLMPRVPVYTKRTKPLKPFKKDGTYSVGGARWFALLEKEGFNKNYVGDIKEQVGDKEANPVSHQQIKNWLFSLGWKPINFDYKRDDEGNERKIPQVRVEVDGMKELCPSVLKLIIFEPALVILQGLTILQHRVSVFKGFLRDQEDGYLTARVSGFTNTLRFRHKELVNLPGIDKPYGDIVRGSLMAREGMVLCGSDMVSLEDTTKRHYMFDYDPEYVEEMSVDGFDPHLDLAKFAGVVTQEEIVQYVNKQGTERNIKGIRKNFKVVNYSATYGVREKTLSRSSGLPVSEAKELLEVYWKRNWSLKEISSNVEVKKIKGEMWLLNPVSGFWYSLRYEKDIFSTLNQGTGVYVFDTWIKHFRKVRPQLTAQFHDEVVLEIKQGAEEKCKALLHKAMDNTNDELKLNVTLGVDVQFGSRYSEIH